MSELERLRDRVAELEDAMGLTAGIPRDLIPRELVASSRVGSPETLKFIGIVLARPFAHRESVYASMFGGRPECDQPGIRILHVYAWRSRQILSAYGVALKNIRGKGWVLSPADKAKLRGVIAQINGERQAA